ncbi:MAG: hypothetical protein U1E83_10760 [Methylotetracoccus sp.]
MRQRRRGCAALHVLLLLLIASSLAHAVEVVVNRSVPEASIKLPTAWAIFSMRLRTWSDGTPTTVFVLRDSNPLHAEFTKQVLDTFPYQLRRAWDRVVFSGTGQAPTEVGSVDEMYERLLSTSGSIGYLPDSRIDGRLRILKIDRVRP